MGECPDKKQTSRFATSMHTDVTLNNVKKKGKETLYAFTENKTGNAFALSCAGQRITVVN